MYEQRERLEVVKGSSHVNRKVNMEDKELVGDGYHIT